MERSPFSQCCASCACCHSPRYTALACLSNNLIFLRPSCYIMLDEGSWHHLLEQQAPDVPMSVRI